MSGRHLAAVLASFVAGAAWADDAAIKLTRRTEPGREVLIRGFAEFHADCRLRHVQTISVVEPPAHGRVEVRPGVVTVGPNWVGSAHCEGTRLDGVQVYYVPQAEYRGADRFAFDVAYQSARTVRAEVAVQIAPK